MATTVMPPAKRSSCVYRALKLDAEVLAVLRLAVAQDAISGRPTTMQELGSDILNEALAKRLSREPVRRKPPPDNPGGRPPRK